MPARNRRNAASSTSPVMSGRGSGNRPTGRTHGSCGHDTDARRKSCIIAAPWSTSDSARLLRRPRTHRRAATRRSCSPPLAHDARAAAGARRRARSARGGRALRRACARRAAGVPVAYLLGRREFWSLDFEVTPGRAGAASRNRAVSRARAAAGDRARGARSPISAPARAPSPSRSRTNARTGASRAPTPRRSALAVARRNGERAGAWPRRMAAGRLVSQPLDGRRFDALASNPPYIAADDPVLDGGWPAPRAARRADARAAMALGACHSY